MMSRKWPDRSIYGWALYDFANSAFATCVIAGFFPIFLKQYWTTATEVTQSTFYLGLANAGAGLAVGFAAPLLGAIADQGGMRKKFLVLFACLGIAATASLYWVEQGHWFTALMLFAIANLGFSGSNVFYDALIVDVSRGYSTHMVSGLGYAFGYFGGGLIFAVIVAMTLYPDIFGLRDTIQAIQVSFLLVSAWWFVFSVPLLLLVHERRSLASKPQRGLVSSGLRRLRTTLGNVRRLRPVALFLAAYWLYIDGVDTIVRMSVDFGLSLGFTSTNLVISLLIAQAVGFPATLLFATIGDRWGPKRGILVGLAIYMGITLWAFSIRHEWEFYGLAAAVGLVQGGVQALSRSLYSHMIPAEESAEFFGIYNLLGKFAAVIGPLLVGITALVSNNPRHGILAVELLFIAGALLLARLKVTHGHNSKLS